jgi:two-component system copper resistance phosphate regulon response regulator CusR
MRILLLEDDHDLAQLLAAGLRAESYAVDVAASVAAATEHLTTTQYDVACLDLGLPDGDGISLLQQLSSADTALHRPARIIVTTARDAVADRVTGLDAGADDYLVKPFAFAELTARIRALGRRDKQPGNLITVDDLEIDLAAQQAWRRESLVSLTAREFAVLRYLAHHVGQVVSQEEILEHVWDANADPFTGSPRVIMSRLRRKLGEPSPIETVTGAGYRLGQRS